MGDDDQPAKAKKPKKPDVNKDAPKDFKDFVQCREDKVTLKPGKATWYPGPLSPDVKFAPGAKAGTVDLTADFGAGPVTIPMGVDAGKLTVDTSKLPGADALTKWVDDFNEWMAHKGKKLGGLKLDKGELTLEKTALVAAAPAGGGIKLGGVRPGHLLPDGEKIGAGLLCGLFTIAGVLLVNVGDETVTHKVPAAGQQPIAVAGALCTPSANGTELGMQAIVTGANEGDTMVGTARGPDGAIQATGKLTSGYLDLRYDLGSNGYGRYTDFKLRDRTLGLRVSYRYDLPHSYDVTHREDPCPGRAGLTGGTATPSTPVAPSQPSIFAWSLGYDHMPFAIPYREAIGNQPIQTPSILMGCFGILNGVPGQTYTFGATGPTGTLNLTGILDPNRKVLAVGGITSFGSYQIRTGQVVGGSPLTIPADLMAGYQVSGGADRVCSTSDLPAVPATTTGGSAPTTTTTLSPPVHIEYRVVTEETDGFPWSLPAAIGADVLVVGGLYLDKRRRLDAVLGTGPAPWEPPVIVLDLPDASSLQVLEPEHDVGTYPEWTPSADPAPEDSKPSPPDLGPMYDDGPPVM